MTKEYVYVKIANKNAQYFCSECGKDVIFCNGQIIKPYFRQAVDNNKCNYYTKPTEGQIHKDAKMLLKKLLETKNVSLIRNCKNCNQNENMKYLHLMRQLMLN